MDQVAVLRRKEDDLVTFIGGVGAEKVIVGAEEIGVSAVKRILADDFLAHGRTFVIHCTTFPNLSIEIEFSKDHLDHALVGAAVFILAGLCKVAPGEKVIGFILHPVEEIRPLDAVTTKRTDA